jgi:hypothetical protein
MTSSRKENLLPTRRESPGVEAESEIRKETRERRERQSTAADRKNRFRVSPSLLRKIYIFFPGSLLT